MEHGTHSAYQIHKCSCGICLAFMKVYRKEQREKMKSRPIPSRAHGTYAGYREYHCKCDKCKAMSTLIRGRPKQTADDKKRGAARIHLRRTLRAEYIKSCKEGHRKDRWPAEGAAKLANVDISVVRNNSSVASSLEHGDLRYHAKLDLVFYEER